LSSQLQPAALDHRQPGSLQNFAVAGVAAIQVLRMSVQITNR
jgi:hypothetical protein